MSVGNGARANGLAQRLAEAEGIIAALLSGQVDAVVEPKTKSPLLLAKAQEALRLSKRHLRDIIDGLGPGIFVGLLTPDGILVEVNHSPLAAAGLKPEDVIGKPFDQTPWWSGSEEIRQQLRDAIARAAQGEASRYDVRTRGEGDEIIDIDFSLQPMRDESGEVVFLIPSASVITERKQMEAALRDSESQQREIARQLELEKARLVDAQSVAKVGSWETNLSTGSVIWSGETHRIFETNGDTFHPTHDLFLATVHPDDRIAVDAAFLRSATQPGTHSIEHRVLLPDGRIKFVEERWRTLSNSDGNLRASGTCQDISERKVADRAVRESNEKFRQLADNITDVFWMHSADFGEVQYVSPAFERIWGVPLERAYSDPEIWTQSIVPEDRERVAAATGTLLADAHSIDFEFSIARPDGERRLLRSRGFQVRDADNKLIRVIGITTDITERMRMQSAVMEQASLLDNAREAIQVQDLNGCVIYWNKGAERLYGFTASEMMGRKTLGVICSDASGTEAAQAALLAKGEWQGEMIKRTKDGRDITVDVRWTLVLDAHGLPKSVLAIDADVTSRKTLESQLMVSDRMASVGTLAAGVAHEINNPLAALIANLDFIAESFAPGSGGSRMKSGRVDAGALDEIRGPLEDAREAAQRVRAIVRDLKIFSRSPTAEERGPVNVKTIMESSLGMAWNEIRHRARLVKVYGEVPDVEANEGRLGQVFLNLLVNAAQAMSEGRAEHNEIRVTTRLQGERVITEVCDTGPGIPPEIIGRIFDAFFTTKAVGVGTGLGLAICQRIITDMGGSLTVKSEMGKGTTFCVALPVATTDEREVETPVPAAVVSARRGRILVIDDELMLVKIVTRILSKEHDVVSTLAAREGLAFCARGDKFDLILCDLMMPDMTGMDLHRELSLVAPEMANRMIFLTGGAFTPKARSFLTDPPKEHIEKPFDAANLRAIVQRYLRSAVVVS